MKNLARWEPVAEGVMQKVIEPVNDEGYVKFSDIKHILKPSNNNERDVISQVRLMVNRLPKYEQANFLRYMNILEKLTPVS